MASLEDFASLSGQEAGLVVVCTIRKDGTAQASVVNAGVMAHPASGKRGVAFVARGGALKLRHLRRDPRITVVARSGWQWAAVEGTADLAGPDDPHPDVDAEAIPELLRDVFRAAGGTHDDWAEYDRVMASERRTAVFVTPTRVYSNG